MTTRRVFSASVSRDIYSDYVLLFLLFLSVAAFCLFSVNSLYNFLRKFHGGNVA